MPIPLLPIAARVVLPVAARVLLVAMVAVATSISVGLAVLRQEDKEDAELEKTKPPGERKRPRREKKGESG